MAPSSKVPRLQSLEAFFSLVKTHIAVCFGLCFCARVGMEEERLTTDDVFHMMWLLEVLGGLGADLAQRRQIARPFEVCACGPGKKLRHLMTGPKKNFKTFSLDFVVWKRGLVKWKRGFRSSRHRK